MSVVDGNLLRVYVGGTAIAYATSSTLNLTAQVDELAPTSSSAAAFTVVKPRRKSGSISTNALYGAAANYDFEDIFDAWKNGTALTIAFSSPGTDEWEVSSSAYVSQVSASGSVREDASLRITFVFSGTITRTTNT